jgi:PAS domain S-box-containing protein
MTAEHQGIILVVDDEAANLGVLFEHLRREGFKVLIAEDGASAFERVEYMPPDIMVLDLKLPDMDGFELYRQLRKRPQLTETPVIFLSALTGMAEKLKAFEMSAVDYVTKPFEPEEVVARIDKHLTIRNLRKQLEKTNAQLRQEIAEHKQKEAALQNSQEQLALIIDNMPALIGYVDAYQRYIYVNQAYAEWCGNSKETLIGKLVRDILSEEGYHRVCHYIETVLQGKRVSFEDRRVDRHGQSRSISVDYVPHFDGQGNIKAFFVLIQDITRYKQLQDALQEAKDAAESANQAKTVFLANMSHELRTPLNAILGFAQLMAKNPRIPGEEQENLGIIQRSGEHLLTLINQVLDLSKIEAGQITVNEKDIDLFRLLQEVEEIFTFRTQQKGLSLVINREDTVPQYIRTDDVKLRQVLINLLSNAVKFTKHGGVTVRVKGQRLKVKGQRQEGETLHLSPFTFHLYFEIEDTGPGIAPEELNTLFEPFTQTITGRQLQEGTGLGLGLSRKFAQLMGGDIMVTSDVGRGATFTFTLQVGIIEQASLVKQPSLLARRPIALEHGQPRYRMLIADDKRDQRKLLVTLLHSFAISTTDSINSGQDSEQRVSTSLDTGFELREATNGQEAFELWQTWQPHLIWMNIRMPIMDGYTATRKIRNSTSEHRNVPIIAMSTSSFEDEHDIAISKGCDDFLRKPFREVEVFDLLHKHLGIRFVYEEGKGQKAKGEGQKVKEVLTPEAFAALPDELRIGLQHAVEIIDMERANSLINQIREHDKPLAEVLAKLVKNYRFDTLQELFGGREQ